jgi:hypothetical protein
MVFEHEVDPLMLKARRLEDAFFLQNDKSLIEKQKALKRMKETKDALRKASGIHNEAVLQKLVELDVRPETIASLSVIPLVEVAWADGSVSKSEEGAVLAGARKTGIKEHTMEYALLKQWLRHKPPVAMMDAWVHYVQGLCEKFNVREKNALKKEVLGNAQAVAEASGGVLGIGAVSGEEKAVLAKLKKAFG